MRKIGIAPDGRVMRTLFIIEWAGLGLITLATIVAIGQEFAAIVVRREVLLQDILLLFIYLEIITMVALYLSSGKLPVRYPLYIAMVAIARYIIIGMKEIQGWNLVALSLAILVLAIAVLVIRYGHRHLAYDE
ncbi:MAG: phosphate-starvation-inducible PsiE family protein [Gammaproteobacteria bacterium]